jgi:hypothetical protein
LSEKDDLWYVQISLYNSTENFEVQTFCNQCGEIIFQAKTEKICPKCKSDKWDNNPPTRQVRAMLQKIGQDPDFTQQIKRKYLQVWNEKFPKYKIPEPNAVGKLVPHNSEDNS